MCDCAVSAWPGASISGVRMQTDQVDVTTDVVRGLLAEQFPEWPHVPLRPIPLHGSVNALFRLGDHLVLRFPLHRASALSPQSLPNFDEFACDLAGLVRAVHGIDTGGRRWDGLSRAEGLSHRPGDRSPGSPVSRGSP